MAQKLVQATRMVHGVVSTFQVTQATYDEWEAAGLLYPGVVKTEVPEEPPADPPADPEDPPADPSADPEDPPADPPADPAPAPKKRATRKKASDDDATTDPAEA
ncbi:hypothetical protein [Actinomyces provencensis]|uniref:hypothetical protein n=1 Tax=Actinomyces provencensis TaxID=1720198 RepID=UPI0012B5CF1E|nr:hypothetical protein [Actinomyces provencensis]